MRTPIYLYHVPRTGGTALNKALQKHPLVKLVSDGHERWHKRKGLTVAFLRDPAAHMVSMYDYIRHRNHAERDHAQKCGSFAAWAKAQGSSIGNFIKFFSQSVTLDEAIENLQRVSFVGFTDRLQNDFNLALKTFGINCVITVPRANETPDPQKTKLTAKDIKLAHKLRSEDYKLYQWALKHRGR